MHRPASLACLLVATASLATAAPPEYQGDLVVRVVPQDLRSLRLAMAVAGDIWSHGIAVDRPVDLRVTKEALATLERAGLHPEVLIPDLGSAIVAERTRIDAANANQGGVAGGTSWFLDYKTLGQINAKLDEFAAQRPDLVTTFDVGNSLENRTIRGIRISSAAPGAPAILINGCQHAREWISPMTVMYIANQLVDQASTDPAIANLLATAEVFIIPVANPDGYQYTWDVNRLWRKNRRNNGDGSFGVDLNRNWGYQWGGSGASANPSDETYRGPSAFSEPESSALRDFYLAHPNIVSSIDFHSYGQLVMSAWGYTTSLPPDAVLLQSIANGMRDAIFTVHSMPYTAGPIGPTLYLAAGNIVDWAYGDQGALAYTIELRDTGSTGFLLPADQILPTGEENFAAFMTFGAATTKPVAVSFPNGIPSEIEADLPTTVAITATPIAGQPTAGQAFLYSRDTASAGFTTSPLASAGGNAWTATLPATACGKTLDWYVEFGTNLGPVRSPSDAPATTYHSASIVSAMVWHDTFETNLGWTVGGAGSGDNATSGLWTRVDPVGTIAQPENDSSTDGTICFVTGQGAAGGADGAADVDNGQTTLKSPVLDCSNPDSVVRYDRWYSNNLGGSPNADSMPIDISNDGGTTWHSLELVTENAAAWVTKSFRVADYVTPTANVRIRFIARDLGSGSLVEAGVDEVKVLNVGCPSPLGDLDANGVVDAADLAILLGAWGQSGPADLDGSGTVDAGDLAILLGAWTA